MFKQSKNRTSSTHNYKDENCLDFIARRVFQNTNMPFRYENGRGNERKIAENYTYFNEVKQITCNTQYAIKVLSTIKSLLRLIFGRQPQDTIRQNILMQK